MTRRLGLLLIGIVAFNTWLMPASAQGDYTWELLPGTEDLVRPVYLTHAGDERLFILEQVGRVWIYQEGALVPFLDITAIVDSEGNEEGLLSIAFDPNYAQNGRFFANFTTYDSTTSISRYQVSADDPNVADPNSRHEILSIDQPYPNHNGGQLHFGPDGYLYIGMGDGGSGGDPQNHGQRLDSLLGKMLRIDVSGDDYTIPPDNPFINNPEARPEIWAWGLRNPWRFSFDRATGDLYMADVGQTAREEINFQPAGSPGGENYGWRFFEGNANYQNAPADRAGFAFPVAEYSHRQGCSVTGGYVYRGSALPALQGLYFYADYCYGTVWTLQKEAAWQNTVFMETGWRIVSFGEDVNGELYAFSFSPNNGVYRLVGE